MLPASLAKSRLMRGKIILLLAIGFAAPVMGHGGGLDANGCHHDRKNGGYHCHRGPSLSAPVSSPARASTVRRASSSSKSSAPTLLASPAGRTGDARVLTIQKILLHLGYNPGAATGRMNPQTQFAIMRYEEDEGLPITGKASATMLDDLLARVTD